jgi:histidinol-phosphatase (PHP family)
MNTTDKITTVKSPLFDCHLHSSFSADSETPARMQVERAIALGLDGLCFTEHLDPDYPPEEELDFTIDFAAYFAEMTALQQEYVGRIRIGIGMEFGIQPHLGDALKELTDCYPFDFVIASQHILNGHDPYYPSYFAGRSEQECYAEFLTAQYETLKKMPLSGFDTLGHMDYIVRYGPNRNRDYSYEAYADCIDPILRYLIDHGKCLEVNTGGLKYGLGEPNPCTGVLRRYRELGGEAITIGSDAHEPQHLAYDFDRASALLRALGFKWYTVFEQRRARQLKL